MTFDLMRMKHRISVTGKMPEAQAWRVMPDSFEDFDGLLNPGWEQMDLLDGWPGGVSGTAGDARSRDPEGAAAADDPPRVPVSHRGDLRPPQECHRFPTEAPAIPRAPLLLTPGGESPSLNAGTHPGVLP